MLLFALLLQVWEMLLLVKLQWDVSSVTAFDFVDHLMQRISLCRRTTIQQQQQQQHNSTNDAKEACKSAKQQEKNIRGHALTYVSLCCTGKQWFATNTQLLLAT